VLDEKELEKCPALKSALEKMDTNNDKRLSAEEIAARLTLHQQAGIGITTVACKVWANHGPLEAATVRLIPEPFMGSAFQPAAGVSDANGAVDLRIDGSKYPGVHCGFYRVEVSKTDGAGRESLPARYNAQTTLGAEVAPDMRGGLVFKLTTENKR